MFELAFLVAMGLAFRAIFRRLPPTCHSRIGQLPESLEDEKNCDRERRP